MRNEKEKLNLLFLSTLLLFLLTSKAIGQDLKGTLGYLPLVSESSDKGILVDFINAMQRAYPEGKITFEVVPFKRSLEDAIAGRVDFHAPILKHPTMNEKQLGFSYSDENLWMVTFALYTNRNNKKININNLSKFHIETDAGHVSFFNFPTQPSSCIECSLKKVDMGRIDGYIFAAMESDSIIKKNDLKNIKSIEYKKYEGKFVIPLGKKGKETNGILTTILKRTKRNGDFQKILGQIIDYYKNWKPTE